MSLRIKAPKADDDDAGDRSSIFSFESYESSGGGGGDSRRTSWYTNDYASETEVRLVPVEPDVTRDPCNFADRFGDARRTLSLTGMKRT